jgi:hypothetical protein
LFLIQLEIPTTPMAQGFFLTQAAQKVAAIPLTAFSPTDLNLEILVGTETHQAVLTFTWHLPKTPSNLAWHDKEHSCLHTF